MAKRKILAMILAIVAVLAVATSCGEKEEVPEVVKLSNRDESQIGGLVPIAMEVDFFGVDWYTEDQVVLYDPETNVMYVLIKDGFSTVITPLLNADGTPKLYYPD